MRLRDLLESSDIWIDRPWFMEKRCSNMVYFRTVHFNAQISKYDECIDLIGGIRVLQKEIKERKNLLVSLKQIRRLRAKPSRRQRLIGVGKLRGNFIANRNLWTSINVVEILDTILEILDSKNINREDLISDLRKKIVDIRLSNSIKNCPRMSKISNTILDKLVD